MRSSVAVSALLALLLLGAEPALGAGPPPPGDLDELVALAVERHPEVAALDLDAKAARARTTAAGRPMDAQWMLGVQSLGAMPDSADPTMGMVGVEQMFSLPTVYVASRERAALDARWSEAERVRVAADVKEALWGTAARLRALSVREAAIDEQLGAAEAALEFGRARYGAGAGARGPVAPGAGAAPEQTSTRPPVVAAPSGSADGMGGMGPAKGGMPRGPAGMGEMSGSAGMSEMRGDMPAGMASSMSGEGLAALLRLEAEVARVRADRDGIAARREGEESRLALIVGEDAAGAVTADPTRFLGAPGRPSDVPERALAAVAVESAEADLSVARAARLPTFMVAADVQVMPEGMVNGVDAVVGVTFPLWGGAGARTQAAVAASEAASRRSEGVERGLAESIATARADQSAAEARARALRDVAAPRARAAWEATIAVWGAGGASVADLVGAWQTEVGVTRDAAEAELAVELARARLARMEGR